MDLVPVREMYHSKGFKGTVISFAHEMADAYAAADLVISRAGATTLGTRKTVLNQVDTHDPLCEKIFKFG